MAVEVRCQDGVCDRGDGSVLELVLGFSGGGKARAFVFLCVVVGPAICVCSVLDTHLDPVCSISQGGMVRSG